MYREKILVIPLCRHYLLRSEVVLKVIAQEKNSKSVNSNGRRVVMQDAGQQAYSIWNGNSGSVGAG